MTQLTGKDSPTKNIPKTTAEANQTDIDFGTFDKSEVKDTTIEVTDTGDSPLVIVDVSTHLRLHGSHIRQTTREIRRISSGGN